MSTAYGGGPSGPGPSGPGPAARSLFVTGAASGIGRATARLFAERGYRVGLYDLDEVGLRALAAELGAERCAWQRLDVTDHQAFTAAIAHFGAAVAPRLGVLFNCAGVMEMGRFEEVSIASHQRTVAVNVQGVVNGILAALPLLRASAPACVLSMCSASALYGVPELATYSASKSFVRGLTEALDLELEAEGIRVTDLMPPFVDTPMVSNQARRAGSLRTLGVRLGPEEIAELAWRAVHARRGRTHWVPALWVRVMSWFGNVVPPAARPTMKRISRL